MKQGLAAVFFGALARRRTASLLSVCAIALGVALGLAVQLINSAALEEFGKGIRTLAGEADLRLVGPDSGFDDALFEAVLLHPAVAAASPVLDLWVRLADEEGAIRLLGVDVLRLPLVQPALMPRPHADAADARLAALRQDALFVSPPLAARLPAPADALRLRAAGGTLSLAIAGGVPGAGSQPLAVMDIHAAQRLFGMAGRLSRIDLRLADGVSLDQAVAALQPLLPPGVVAMTPEAALGQAAGLSRAYRVNLTMLAVIALITGGFLVFSTQALSIARRQSEFAFLRALGLSRHSLRRWLLAEGALFGLVGGALGCALGFGFAAVALRLLGGDLGAGYFDGVHPALQASPAAVAGFLALGVLAGIAGAWLPARAAAQLALAAALKAGAGQALGLGRGHPLAAVLCLALALAACLLPPLGGIPYGGYIAIALLLAGGVLALGRLAGALAALCPRFPAPLGLARARLTAMPGQAVVAGSGVLASAALAIAMAVMVASFRDSVDRWLERVLPADAYVRVAKRGEAGRLDPALQRLLLAQPGVAGIDFIRHDRLILDAGLGPVTLTARPVSPDGRELVLTGAGLQVDSPLWISEALADLMGLAPGDPLEVPLAGRSHRFTVAGIWRDYARQSGALVIPLERYRQLSGDAQATEAAVHLRPGQSVEAFAGALRASLPSLPLEIVSPQQIRRISLRIFDRTFAVTYLLEAAAVIIGLAGIAASFAAMAAARRREFGMLRHLGLGRRGVALMIAAEGALTAAAGAVGGAVLGGAIALVLVEVVNRQSFHWSMDYRVPLASLLLFLLALVSLAALASVAAGRYAMSGSAVRAVSEDW